MKYLRVLGDESACVPTVAALVLFLMKTKPSDLYEILVAASIGDNSILKNYSPKKTSLFISASSPKQHLIGSVLVC